MNTNEWQYLWFDLEATGLSPQKNRILEWALVFARDTRLGDMSVIEHHSGVIHAGQDAFEEADEFVQNMHTKNGLWLECADSLDTIGGTDQALVALCQEHTGLEKPKGLVLAGGSVHFDLSFARVHLPKFAALLSHRVLDVSTLKAAERSWGEPFQDIKSDKHRALDDALASLAEAKAIREKRWPA